MIVYARFNVSTLARLLYLVSVGLLAFERSRVALLYHQGLTGRVAPAARIHMENLLALNFRPGWSLIKSGKSTAAVRYKRRSRGI